MRTLSSRRHPLLQEVRALLERSRSRRQASLAVLDGEHLLQDWLRAGRPVQRVLLATSRAGEAARWGAADGIVTLVEDDCLAAVAPTVAPTGLLAIVPVPVPHPMTRGSVLVLDAVQDPGNVGTLLRSAAAGGLDQWVVGGNPAAAVAAPPPEHQPAENGHVVAGTHRMAARRAGRPSGDHGASGRHSVAHHVEKAPHNGSAHEGRYHEQGVEP
jgi:TrmH family RNA methyltransferase